MIASGRVAKCCKQVPHPNRPETNPWGSESPGVFAAYTDVGQRYTEVNNKERICRTEVLKLSAADLSRADPQSRTWLDQYAMNCVLCLSLQSCVDPLL